MYLKDWHFVAEFPDYGAYRLPFFFADDWLNAYYDQQRHRREQQHGFRPHAAFTSDYRFLYLGPAGTWTPLHSDVLRSYSWSANVCGRKRWLILHPRYTHLLYDRQMLRMAPHLEPGRTAWETFRVRFLLRAQEEGDAVFVPSGWHHCVENLHDTLSLNHNWLNGHNCHWTWALLRQQYVDAAEAIEDCRQLCSPDEFEGLVQSNLAANMGLNWHGFVDLLGCTVRSALASLCAARGGLSDARGDPLSGVGSFSQEVATEGGDHCAAVMNQLLALQRAGRKESPSWACASWLC
ncbi:hypothetical protein VOLCADRAFT_56346 [Volvox carteri f. nagariensis]|uniref:JmjC domain-containing protein n=1 Tax=Volvox carteri f. nagariensis TaxID=3068 RepID=D8TKM4_VOLCA|nr:uncharacterized protein VOLCADRAFT_56346 [Volvox carteri f. nagariensis]EFJ51911.1 hypothetical protein VOLCADRAFT_56346 [Volvox carteri f. nagariensis]|eukprot:XP_002946685.1 hypothetical protein VOLCADRAFT_56346 [Volvox carteri f. nagariensis]